MLALTALVVVGTLFILRSRRDIIVLPPRLLTPSARKTQSPERKATESKALINRGAFGRAGSEIRIRDDVSKGLERLFAPPAGARLAKGGLLVDGGGGAG